MKLFDDDALAIATIWQEAEGESFTVKAAIGEVIRERMRRRYSSDGTIVGTVARRYQFSAFNDDEQDNARFIQSLKLDFADHIVQDCMSAWYVSEHTDYSKKAVLFCNTDVAQPPWATPDKLVAKIGHVSFYKD